MSGPILTAKECVTFRASKFDSHAAYDAKTKVYTFVMDGDYVYQDETGKWHKVKAKAGDTIKHPSYVVGENCGQFYGNALKSVQGEQDDAKA